MPDDVPEWFRRAVGTTPDEIDLRHEGRHLRVRRWGRPGPSAPIVLVHGLVANSSWWDHVAPLLDDGRREVVAMDLSGHGESDHADDYGLESWSAEVLFVIDALDLVRPLVVGHSMGGRVAWEGALRNGRDWSGVATIDSAVIPDRVLPWARSFAPAEAASRMNVYPDPAAALKNFRLLPPQPRALDFITTHIVRRSMREEGDGWVWKHDPQVVAFLEPTSPFPDALDCPYLFIRSEHGVIDPGLGRELSARLPQSVTEVEIPHAGHHPMLDEPLSLVTALRLAAVQQAEDLAVNSGVDES